MVITWNSFVALSRCAASSSVNFHVNGWMKKSISAFKSKHNNHRNKVTRKKWWNHNNHSCSQWNNKQRYEIVTVWSQQRENGKRGSDQQNNNKTKPPTYFLSVANISFATWEKLFSASAFKKGGELIGTGRRIQKKKIWKKKRKRKKAQLVFAILPSMDRPPASSIHTPTTWQTHFTFHSNSFQTKLRTFNPILILLHLHCFDFLFLFLFLFLFFFLFFRFSAVLRVSLAECCACCDARRACRRRSAQTEIATFLIATISITVKRSTISTSIARCIDIGEEWGLYYFTWEWKRGESVVLGSLEGK